MIDPFFNAPLAEVDPEIAQVLERELDRQRGYLEMIASENFVPVSVLQSQGSVLTNKYAEGYPGKALLRGLRGGRRRRGARDRASEEPVRRRVRERPAALGRDGQRRGAARSRYPGRHDPRARARPGRSPHARHEDQLLRPALRHRRLRRRPRDLARRHGRGRAPRARPTAPRSSSRDGPPTRGSSTSRASARSPMPWAPTSGSTWPTSPDSSPPASIPAPSRTRTSCPPRCTRRSAVLGRASS